MSAAAALLALALAVPGAAAGDSLAVDPDLEEALAELQDAGVAPSAGEWREMLAGMYGAGSGSLRVRAEPTAGPGWDPRVRLRWEGGLFGVRANWRTVDDGERGARGTLRAGGRAVCLWAGDIGHAWGCGLLAAAPGRGASLSASGPLQPLRSGPKFGSSSSDARSRAGGAVALSAGNWTLDASASPAETSEGPAGIRSVATVARRTESLTVGAAAARFGREEGASFAFDAGSGRLTAAAEAAAWRSDGGGGAGSAWVARAGWKRCGPLDLEGVLAAAAGGFIEAGRRPAILPADDARGWALRGSLRPGRGGVVRVLMARGAGRQVGASVLRLAQEIVEVDAQWRCAPSTRLQIRWRRRIRIESTWSERFPWLPPQPEPQDRRMILSLSGSREGDGGALRVLCRIQADASAEGVRRRNLAQVSGRRDLGRGWSVRGVAASAWGGDADLVSAVVPLPGFVLPRHWGRRCGEVLAGIDRRWRHWRFYGALSRRGAVKEDEAATEPGTETTVWAGGEMNW